MRRCSRWRCWPTTTRRLREQLDAYRARQTEAARAMSRELGREGDAGAAARRGRARRPPALLGVMGGGQLGRMFVHAAQAMGYGTAVLDPDAASPAGRVSHLHMQAAYLDAQGLAQLARHCVAITTEFENVPAPSLAALARTAAGGAGRRRRSRSARTVRPRRRTSRAAACLARRTP